MMQACQYHQVLGRPDIAMARNLGKFSDLRIGNIGKLVKIPINADLTVLSPRANARRSKALKMAVKDRTITVNIGGSCRRSGNHALPLISRRRSHPESESIIKTIITIKMM